MYWIDKLTTNKPDVFLSVVYLFFDDFKISKISIEPILEFISQEA
jgi:hypothetical protein